MLAHRLVFAAILPGIGPWQKLHSHIIPPACHSPVQGHKFLDGKDRAFGRASFEPLEVKKCTLQNWMLQCCILKAEVVGVPHGRWIADKTYELYRHLPSHYFPRMAVFSGSRLGHTSRWRGLIDHLSPKPHNWVQFLDFVQTCRYERLSAFFRF